MNRISRIFLAAVTAALIPHFANLPPVWADDAEDLAAGARIQQDPKKKEITASVRRSLENETVDLSVNFPDDVPDVRVTLYNLLGRRIEQHPARSAVKGINIFQFATKGLPNGPYIVVLEASGQRLINKVMISR